MEIKDQVCSLEQAKELKDLGVTQKSLFYHHPKFEKPVLGDTLINAPIIKRFPRINEEKQFSFPVLEVCNDKENSCSAFSVAELGEFLKLITDHDKLYFRHSYSNHSGLHKTSINQRNKSTYTGFENIFEIEEETEAGARAETLIHILMSQFVPIDIVNG